MLRIFYQLPVDQTNEGNENFLSELYVFQRTKAFNHMLL